MFLYIMPFKRVQSKGRKSTYRKRKISMRFKTNKIKTIAKLRNQYNMHKFTRWEPLEGESSLVDCNFGSAGTNFAVKNFSLASVVNFNEFRDLYDNYRILGVRVYFDYSPDVHPIGSGSNNSPSLYPKLWVLRDYDDTTTPTLDIIAQSNKSICLRFGSNSTTRSIFIRPAIRNEVFRTSATSSYTNSWGEWLDCTNSDVPHYGLKMISQGIPNLNLGAITIRCKYYLQFKNVR